MTDDDRARTWQLVMVGHGLDPSISHLTLEIGDDRVHVARDWPSDQYEEADRLIDRIAASGVSAIVVHDGKGKPPCRVTTGE